MDRDWLGVSLALATTALLISPAASLIAGVTLILGVFLVELIGTGGSRFYDGGDPRDAPDRPGLDGEPKHRDLGR